MVIIRKALSTLTLNTLYTISFRARQRRPFCVKVTAYDAPTDAATVEFYDPADTITLQDTKILKGSTVIAVVTAAVPA